MNSYKCWFCDGLGWFNSNNKVVKCGCRQQ